MTATERKPTDPATYADILAMQSQLDRTDERVLSVQSQLDRLGAVVLEMRADLRETNALLRQHVQDSTAHARP